MPRWLQWRAGAGDRDAADGRDSTSRAPPPAPPRVAQTADAEGDEKGSARAARARSVGDRGDQCEWEMSTASRRAAPDGQEAGAKRRGPNHDTGSPRRQMGSVSSVVIHLYGALAWPIQVTLGALWRALSRSQAPSFRTMPAPRGGRTGRLAHEGWHGHQGPDAGTGRCSRIGCRCGALNVHRGCARLTTQIMLPRARSSCVVVPSAPPVAIAVPGTVNAGRSRRMSEPALGPPKFPPHTIQRPPPPRHRRRSPRAANARAAPSWTRPAYRSGHLRRARPASPRAPACRCARSSSTSTTWNRCSPRPPAGRRSGSRPIGAVPDDGPLERRLGARSPAREAPGSDRPRVARRSCRAVLERDSGAAGRFPS